MNRKPTPKDQAWGLECGGSAIRLVRVTRTESGFRADRCVEVPLDERWTSQPSLSAAMGRLKIESVQPPLALCVPDEWVLHRVLSLPKADSAILAKVVASQLEVLLPAHAERFTWAWSHRADPFQPNVERAMLCAVRKDALDPLSAACRRIGGEPTVTLPSALSLASAWPLLFGPSDDCVLLLDVAARGASVVIMQQGKVLQCGLIDQGGDHWTDLIATQLQIPPDQAEKLKLEYCTTGQTPESAADPRCQLPAMLHKAMLGWTHHLHEVYEGCVSSIPRPRRPSRCIVVGRAGQTPGLLVLVAQTLGLETHLASRPTRLTLGEGVSFDRSASAIGAAICSMQADEPAINFATAPRGKSPIARRMRWTWPALAAWLIAGVVTLYAMDRHEARWLDQAVQNIHQKTSGQGGMDRQLSIGKYLQAGGSAPLAVLDEICRLAPPQLILTTCRYSRGGEVNIGGTMPNDQELQGFLKKLAESTVFSDVDMRMAKQEQGKLQFEIVLKAAPAWATSQPTTKPASAMTSPTTRSAPAGQATPPPGTPPTGPTTQPSNGPTPAMVAPSPAPSPDMAPTDAARDAARAERQAMMKARLAQEDAVNAINARGWNGAGGSATVGPSDSTNQSSGSGGSNGSTSQPGSDQ